MIKKLVEQNKNYIINMRREFHKYPEPSFQEFRTSKRIQEELTKMGIPFKVIAGTGVVGFINKDKKGKKIILRADMDALQVQECTGVEYCSTNIGMMHACGHDGHTAMLLAFIQEIKLLISQGTKLKKSLVFIFQAAEEGAGGARFIIADDYYKSKNIETIYALHVYPVINVGEFAVKSGFVSLQNIILDIVLTGKGCHGAQPHKGIDSILIGAKLVEA